MVDEINDAIEEGYDFSESEWREDNEANRQIAKMHIRNNRV